MNEQLTIHSWSEKKESLKLVLRTSSSKPLAQSDIAVNFSARELRFTFEKFSESPLVLLLTNLSGALVPKDYTLTKSGDFFTFVFKKEQRVLWNSLSGAEGIQPRTTTSPSKSGTRPQASLPIKEGMSPQTKIPARAVQTTKQSIVLLDSADNSVVVSETCTSSPRVKPREAGKSAVSTKGSYADRAAPRSLSQKARQVVKDTLLTRKLDSKRLDELARDAKPRSPTPSVDFDRPLKTDPRAKKELELSPKPKPRAQTPPPEPVSQKEAPATSSSSHLKQINSYFEMFKQCNLDVAELKEATKKVLKTPDPAAMIELQSLVIHKLFKKVTVEQEDRFKAENQFQECLQQFAKQSDILEQNLKLSKR